jgi:hypothetical protein
MNHKLRLLSFLPFILIVGLMPISGTSVLPSLVTSSSDMVLTVQTDRLYYLRGEVVKIFGTVTHINGTAIEGATIAIEVKNPSNNTIFLDIVYSSSNGSYTDSFRLSTIASIGQYTVYATASKTGYPSVTQLTIFYVTTDDLFLVSIEPIQVILNAKALVKNKASVVRLVVANGFAERKWVEINITYDFGKNSYAEIGPYLNGTPVDPGINKIYIPGGPVFNATHIIQQIWSTSPSWFEWTTVGFDGSITVKLDPLNKIPEANEDNNLLVAGSRVKDTRGFKILYYPLNYFFESPVLGRRMDLQRAGGDTFLEAVYPIVRDEYTSRAYPIDYDLFIPGDIFELMIFQAHAELVRALGGYDRVVAVVPTYYPDTTWFDKWFPYLGDSNMVGYYKMWSTVFVEEGYWTAIAHELGHSYGLTVEEYETNPPGNPAEGYWAYSSIHPIYKKQLKGPIEDGFCFMGPLPFQNYSFMWAGTYKPVWICNEDYNHLLTEFQLGPDPEVLFVSGFVFRNGTVRLNPWYRIPEAFPDIQLGSSGNYTLLFLDQAGQPLGQAGFNMSFYYRATELNETGFFLKVPFPPGTANVQLIHNATVLASRNVSSNSPNVIVVYPNGGETFTVNQNITIRWEGGDLDGDPLTYTILYSFDNGSTWLPIATNLEATSVNWTTPNDTPTDLYLIKVVATDGVNTAEDISDSTFTVGIHDIAITNITLSKEKPSPGEKVYINITVQNRGHFTETFNVSTYYTRISDPLIGTQTITIVGGENATLTFEWTANATGRYQILANTTEIPNDIDPTNNIRTTILYVGYGENPGSYTSESINGFHMASFIFTFFASVMILAVRKNKEMPLSEMPASIIKRNLHQGLSTNVVNMWQDQIRRQSI